MPHLLVVEGESHTRDILQAQLGRSYRVSWAATRQDGREMFRNRSVNLVLLESRLPDGCGLELLREIKGISPGLPVIMVTGFGSEVICARAFKLGARDYFMKPVVAADLLRSVRQILSVPWRQVGPRANILRPPMTSKCVQPQTGDPRIDFAIRLIHDRYDEKLTLGVIARSAGTGLFSLSRKFTEAVGISFRTYLLRVRVATALEFLKDGTLPIADVAERAGFRDASWFNKVFKRYQGVPPSIYRKSLETRNAHRNAKTI